MKTIKNKAKQLSIIVVLAIGLVACNSKTEKKEVKKQPVATTQTVVEDTQQNYQVGSQVPNELVCMVNDAYMAKPQIPVPVNGKTYYGCCQMCVGTLNDKESARTGIDPFSNKPVDKTEAYIVLMKKEGDVAYFESEANFMKFKKGN
tara:strand:+ start:330 stop:770 length:441 start_codon:yes stop_codon:yes gene_type:complete